ncbi:nucleoside/nucleotide kinase family protein [Marivita sp. S2033]|uniref:nucleoside/nucleotide kinase family protein n=1 Tax=Marivita sp. S2033 TaxID=3373187 RepID=UPI0039822D45
MALAGPPASGKSTLSQSIAAQLSGCAVVPMDGFHLDNTLLNKRGLIERKGAPETFDVAGFAHLLSRLKNEREVVYPVFDRSLDKAIAGVGLVGADTETVIVEGNYLLLDTGEWARLGALWDFTIKLNVPEQVLRQRLLKRWRDHGFTESAARQKTEGNDLPNQRICVQHSRAADLDVGEI